MKKIYLDYAAATPMAEEVEAAMRPYLSGMFHNPSATYLSGRAARHGLDRIRGRIAAQLGARPAEVVFTAGATEANNLAIQGLMKRYPQGEALVSAIEHESVLAPAGLFAHKRIPVDEWGRIILNKLSILITDKTVLISVMLVNNELGTIQPLRDIAEIIAQVRDERKKRGVGSPLYLHTDAAQAGNYLDLHAARLGVDMMTINGGKLYGPKQSGALFIKAGIKLEPLILGGGQEFGLRSGTENIAAGAGLAAALELAAAQRQAETSRVMALRRLFEEEIRERRPDTVINGGQNGRAPHIVSLTVPGADNERLMMELDEAGIECAVGSACSASREEASHVLSAIGLDEETARATLRFSLGRQSTEADIRKTVRQLAVLTDGNR